MFLQSFLTCLLFGRSSNFRFKFPCDASSFLVRYLRNRTVLGMLAPLREHTCSLTKVHSAQHWAGVCMQGMWWNDAVPFPPQGIQQYLHLPHLCLYQQQLPCLLRAQRCPHSSCPRLWMAWAEGPYSAPSRISKKELWGKPKPAITVLLRSAKASCLHLEGKVVFFVLFCFLPTSKPLKQPLPGWIIAEPVQTPYCFADVM